MEYIATFLRVRFVKVLLLWVMLITVNFLFVSNVSSSPYVLEDSFLEELSAGNTMEEGRGVITGNNSQTSARTKTGLKLSSEVQQGAKGLNLINSVESASANTINIWDGDMLGITVEGSDRLTLEVNQVNDVHQTQPQSATVSGYSRPDTEYTEVINHSYGESYLNDQVNIHNVTDRFEEMRITGTSNESNVDTSMTIELGDNLFIEGHLGQGVASSGFIDAEFDGGEAEFAFGIHAGIEADVGTTINGVLGTSLTFDASASAEVGLTLVTNIELPHMDLELSGAGCGVMLGSCYSSGSTNEFIMTSSDNSTSDIFENHQSGTIEFIDEYTGVSRSSFELESAKATYLVIDDSALELYSDITLELSESAQKEAEGINIVNAIGSNVANSTNISRAIQFNSSGTNLILNQFNVVNHGH